MLELLSEGSEGGLHSPFGGSCSIVSSRTPRTSRVRFALTDSTESLPYPVLLLLAHAASGAAAPEDGEAVTAAFGCSATAAEPRTTSRQSDLVADCSYDADGCFPICNPQLAYGPPLLVSSAIATTGHHTSTLDSGAGVGAAGGGAVVPTEHSGIGLDNEFGVSMSELAINLDAVLGERNNRRGTSV